MVAERIMMGGRGVVLVGFLFGESGIRERGVGEARIMLPKSVGISASAKGGIGEIRVDGLEKKADRWVNPGHESDAVQITVDAKGGVGEIYIVAQ